MSIKLIIRPWADMFSTHAFSLPKNADQLAERIRYNLNYWLCNYLIFIGIAVFVAGYVHHRHLSADLAVSLYTIFASESANSPF